MDDSDLVIGIDGGGSKTLAWLAPASGSKGSPPLGRGQAGPCNPQSVGWEMAKHNLAHCVNAAFHDGGVAPCRVGAACIALAGGDRGTEQHEITSWAHQRRLARHVRVVNDAMPVLAAGTPRMVGISVIAGTGSIAFGRNAAGVTARAGGWGHLLGDEGSGYAIAVAALRSVVRSLDDRAEPTALTALLFNTIGLTDPSQLVPAFYARCHDRPWIASLSPLVFDAAEHEDAVARRIIDDAGAELATMTIAVACRLDLNRQPRLALAGGTLVHHQLLRDRLLMSLAAQGWTPCEHVVVANPVAGSVELSRRLVRGERSVE